MDDNHVNDINISQYLGGGGTTYVNNHKAPTKDTVINELIPNEISECAIFLHRANGEACISADTTNIIGKALNISGDNRTIIDAAKDKLNCQTEKCVLDKMSATLGKDKVKKEMVYLKIAGPTDSKLLSNFNIDAVLSQWSVAYPDFFPYNFNMKNYASYAYENGYVVNHPDTLATIPFSDLYSGELNGKKYRCCGCVINTDTYQGNGKHWMVLFADARKNTEWSVEFFNSSGNAPAPEWISWLEKTKNIMESIATFEGVRPAIKVVRVTSIRHQQSKTECGLYSLFYIWARLHKISYKYFMDNVVPDQLMFEFRQHLFDDPTKKSTKVFDWDEYKNRVHIEWE